MWARLWPPLPRTCCPSARVKSSMWTAAFILGDSNASQEQPPPHGSKTAPQDRAAVLDLGGEDPLLGTILEAISGRAGLHRERPLLLPRLDGVDAGLSVWLGVAPV